ncbi:DUF1322 family protein [Borreliella burgdorferi]|uniref:Uncharacterized protein n=5 Tax=Borreliella TaxID=64895 RepID=O50942_BORBU|nr:MULTISPECIES: DUF1322 family protein [Borreliella]AAC66281.1 conserved hypothetical protein [Borreliella burgdorferi B31]ACK74218.1 conserved hypothetical protein [Borreliella burgdorferi ZS7]ACL33777.1 conserved hypothetical protein [Borreliella burgdorferi 156a]ACM10077.1 conserved hypothetical protein [Borreliella burgdorferi 72a]ACN24324.1 conserved hypothetical protein [Borreliella burgdorferi 64b]
MNKQEIATSYFKYIDYLTRETNKYYFPVVMGICTYKDVKKMGYKELVEVNRVANLKLNKEIYERFLSFSSVF